MEIQLKNKSTLTGGPPVKQTNYKDAFVFWKRSSFDKKELLPERKQLYTQLYDIPEKGKNWSLLLEFEQPPRDQGYECIAKVKFLSNEGPEEILSPGFKFDFFDGEKIVGQCEII